MATLVVLTGGCAPSAPASAPASASAGGAALASPANPEGRSRERPDEAAAPQASPVAADAPSAAFTADAPPVAEPESPTPRSPMVAIRIEPPYKLDARPPPKTQEEYKRDILDRRHWNGGGMGELLGEPAGVEGHPDPRVIVNVEEVQGSHDRKKLEIVARKYHWKKVVGCYRLGAFKDPHLRGWTKGSMRVSASGRVVATTFVDSELKDREVARCMVDELEELELPPAKSSSRVKVAMRVGPGDEPMPPPDDLLVPGEGELSLEAMREGVEAGLGAFEVCYRAAFAYAPGLWGRVILRFHVTEQGRLDEAFQINRRFPDRRVSQCIEHAARKLHFARPAGGDVRFVVPLRLSSDRADTEAR